MCQNTETALFIVLLWMVSSLPSLLGQTPGSWRLVTKNERTSRSLTAGRLEIFYDGRWGTVCSDGFDSNDASVLCKILTGSLRYLRYGTVESDDLGFNQGSNSSPIWITNLKCSQTQTSATCSHDGYGNTRNCSHSKDVALSCHAEGAVRLSYKKGLGYYNPGAQAGRLEVYHNGRWGTVCSIGFDQVDADVACRQLGYDRAYRYGNVNDIGYNFGDNRPFWTGGVVNCTSNDIFLANCSRRYDYGCYSLSNFMAVVECLPQLIFRLVTKGERTAPYLVAGRVEVLHNGQWGTICSKGFDWYAAQIICHRLTGSSSFLKVGEVGSYQLQFDQGPSTTPVLLENLHCSTETHQCHHNGFGNTDCSHERDIAISCEAPGAIKLVKDSFYSGPAGRLEHYVRYYIGPFLRVGYRWEAVCAASGFDQVAADVACRQLGYEKAYKYGTVSDLGYRSVYTYSRRKFRCSSNDLLLANCTYWSNSSCTSDNLIAVSCVEPIVAEPGLSGAQKFGIVFSILIVICCAVCQITGFICYKKGACKSATGSRHSPQHTTTFHRVNVPASSTTYNHYSSNYASQNHTSDSPYATGPIYNSQIHYSFSSQQQTGNNLTTEPSAPPLEAVTHAGEAPPAYHIAVHYKTVTDPDKDVRLFRDSALYEQPKTNTNSDAPPAYKEATESTQ